MAIQVVINGSVYDVPVQGQNPPWGEDLTDVIVALATAVNSVTGSSDILLTTFSIANNVAVATNVVGATFDTTQVRSAIITYSLYRSSTTTEMAEVGNIYLTYKSTAGTWDISQNYGGSSGVVFSITNAGQLQYTSSNFSGTSYVGTMKFKAEAFLQT